MKGKIVFVLLSILSLLACSKASEYSDDETIEVSIDCTGTEEHILFQADFENQSWGYVHDGWFVNCKGECKSYRLNKDNSWLYFEENPISQDKLLHNVQFAENNFHQLEAEELQEMTKLALELHEEEVKITPPHMADAGKLQYWAYHYDEKTQEYKRVLIDQSGDLNIINHHPNSITLKEWLIKIQRIYRSNI